MPVIAGRNISGQSIAAISNIFFLNEGSEIVKAYISLKRIGGQEGCKERLEDAALFNVYLVKGILF